MKNTNNVRKTLKKSLAFVLMLALCVGILSVTAFADYAESEENAGIMPTLGELPITGTEELDLDITVTSFDELKDAIDNGYTVINVSGSITINEDLDGRGATVKFSGGNDEDDFSYVIISGNVTITNLTMDGNGSKGRAIRVQNGKSLTLGDGAVVTGFTTKYFGGGLYGEENSTINLENGAIVSQNTTTKDAGRDVDYGGGGIYTRGTLNINGGSVIGNVSAGAGGGIYLDRHGDEKTTSAPNSAHDEWYKNGEFCSKFTMTSGTISNNVAKNSEGGGIYCEGEGEIVPVQSDDYVYITNNTTETSYDFGGGGIFIEASGRLNIIDALITGNTAYNYGGGLSGCTNAVIYNIKVDDGAAIYDNIAKGLIYSDKYEYTGYSDAWNDGHNDTYGGIVIDGVPDQRYLPTNWVEQDYLQGNDVAGKYKADKAAAEVIGYNGGWQDYYCCRDSMVAANMLGGGNANWYGTWSTSTIENSQTSNTGLFSQTNAHLTDGRKWVTGDQITATVTGTFSSGSIAITGLMGLTANPSAETKAAAKAAARVFISGNTSYSNGGGITCNGLLSFGNTTFTSEDVGVNLTLNGNKVLTNSSPVAGQFTFVLKFDGVEITAQNDANGKFTFNIPINVVKSVMGDEDSKSVTLEVYEQNGVSGWIDYTDVIYRGTATLTKDSVTVTVGNSGHGIPAESHTTTTYTLSNIKFDDENYTKNSLTFTNTYRVTNIDLSKMVSLAEGDSLKTPSDGTYTIRILSVQLLDTDAAPIDITVELNAENGYHAVVENLPVGTYTVSEAAEELDDFTLSDSYLTYEGQTLEDGVIDLTGQESGSTVYVVANNFYTVNKDASLSIHKDVTLDESEHRTAEDTDILVNKEFRFSVTGTGFDGSTYENIVTVKAGETVTLTGLAHGVYEIREEVTDLDNYTFDEDASRDALYYRAVLSEKDDASITVTFTATNVYTRNLTDLSVAKTVAGDLGEDEREWNFNVTLTVPEYVTIDGAYATETTWEDTVDFVDDVTGEVKSYPVTYTQQGEIVFERQAEGTYKASFTLKHGQTITIKGLPEGVDYDVNEVEANTDGYITSDSNSTGTLGAVNDVYFINARNSTLNRTTQVSVNKVWAGDEGIDRPESVSVQLYANGAAYGASVTLSEANGWSYTWSGLPADGYTYTVEEIDIPAGYTASVTGSGTSYTIVNTYDITTTIPDGDIPLGPQPELDIPDMDVPLDSAPKTGDDSHDDILIVMMLVSAFGLASICLITVATKIRRMAVVSSSNITSKTSAAVLDWESVSSAVVDADVIKGERTGRCMSDRMDACVLNTAEDGLTSEPPD